MQALVKFIASLLSALPFGKKKEYEYEDDLKEELSEQDQELYDLSSDIVDTDSYEPMDDDMEDFFADESEEIREDIPAAVVPHPHPQKGSIKEKLQGFIPRKKHSAVNTKKTVVSSSDVKEGLETVKNPDQKKTIVLSFVLVAMLGVLLGLYYMTSKNEDRSQTQNNSTKELTVSNEDSDSLPVENDVLYVNPFIESSILANMPKTADGSVSLPAVPSVASSGVGNPVRASGMPALPAIPGNFPRPNIPAASPMQAPSNTPQASSGSPATVQGVFTSEDGSNMAIMSDGTVVGEGESYRDGRIAFIGGDGVHFENGTVLKY